MAQQIVLAPSAEGKGRSKRFGTDSPEVAFTLTEKTFTLTENDVVECLRMSEPRNRATATISNFTPHSCKNFWYNIGDLIREEGITLMRGDVLVFVARSDSRHILFEGGEQMI